MQTWQRLYSWAAGMAPGSLRKEGGAGFESFEIFAVGGCAGCVMHGLGVGFHYHFWDANEYVTQYLPQVLDKCRSFSRYQQSTRITGIYAWERGS